MLRCSKPGCSAPAGALLTYNYAARLVFLDDRADALASPHASPLCRSCADRLSPPRGWILEDRRGDPVLFVELR